MRTILDGLCRGAGAAREFSFKRVYPPLVNSGPETAVAVPDAVIEGLEPTMASVYFADLLKLVPGCMAFLAGNKPAVPSRNSHSRLLSYRAWSIRIEVGFSFTIYPVPPEVRFQDRRSRQQSPRGSCRTRGTPRRVPDIRKGSQPV